METNIEGVFICGCTQGPKDISDSIAQANAVAAKVDALLSRSTIWMEPITSVVNEVLCRACGTCVDVCEYGAIEITDKDGISIASVNEALCKGCGTCVTSCPAGIATQQGFTMEQIMAEITGALAGLINETSRSLQEKPA